MSEGLQEGAQRQGAQLWGHQSGASEVSVCEGDTLVSLVGAEGTTGGDRVEQESYK